MDPACEFLARNLRWKRGAYVDPRLTRLFELVTALEPRLLRRVRLDPDPVYDFSMPDSDPPSSESPSEDGSDAFRREISHLERRWAIRDYEEAYRLASAGPPG